MSGGTRKGMTVKRHQRPYINFDVIFVIVQDMKITPHGRHLAALPLEPIYANLLLASKNFG